MNKMRKIAKQSSYFLQFSLLVGITWTNSVSVIYLSNVKGLTLQFLNCALSLPGYNNKFTRELQNFKKILKKHSNVQHLLHTNQTQGSHSFVVN